MQCSRTGVIPCSKASLYLNQQTRSCWTIQICKQLHYFRIGETKAWIICSTVLGSIVLHLVTFPGYRKSPFECISMCSFVLRSSTFYTFQSDARLWQYHHLPCAACCASALMSSVSSQPSRSARVCRPQNEAELIQQSTHPLTKKQTHKQSCVY